MNYNIKYKYYPEQKLLFEVVEGRVSVDTLSTFFIELQLDENIKQAKYFLIDHRNMILEMRDRELKRAGKIFDSFNIDLKKCAIISEDYENKEKLKIALSSYQQKHQTEIKFFDESCEKEVCEFLGIKEFPTL